MVKILSCHHFLSQKIGRCEDSVVSLTLAKEIIIIALEHSIQIYVPESIQNLSIWFSQFKINDYSNNFTIGGPYEFSYYPKIENPIGKIYSSLGTGTSTENVAPINSTSLKTQVSIPSPSANVATNINSKVESLRLAHSFSPVDLVNWIHYNERGHFLQCLERRETSTESFTVRIYFHWDKPTLKGKAMKARIAGLVSPTGGEIDSDSLLMVEIPPEPLFQTIQTTSCDLTGNIATLSADSRVNVYAFRLKDGLGRNRPSYADFDLVLSLQFVPNPLTNVILSVNIIGVITKEKLILTKLKQIESPKFFKNQHFKIEPKETLDILNFDPTKMPERFIIRVPSVESENRKLHQPSNFIEQYSNEISQIEATCLNIPPKSPKINQSLDVEDILRVKTEKKQGVTSSFVHFSLHPQRVRQHLGGTLAFLATETEMLIYYIPEFTEKRRMVVRVSQFPFTGRLHSLAFDSSFIHALTESGIETYSNRGLAEILEDVEGFHSMKNDCPLKGVSPSLLGIRPFPGVRFLKGNSDCLTLVSSPTTEAHQSVNDIWTMYMLELPSCEQFYEDVMKTADIHKESNPDVYLSLLAELHIFLRAKFNSSTEELKQIFEMYCDVTRQLGLAYFRKWTSSNQRNLEFLNKGIAFLTIAKTDPKFFFKQGNQELIRDPQLVSGISKFLRVTLPFCNGDEYPPSLTKAIVEFLSFNSIENLAGLVLESSWLRDAQGQRILSALEGQKEQKSWTIDLALIYTLVAIYGTDSEAITGVKKILRQTNFKEEIEEGLELGSFLELKSKKLKLTELTIVFAMTEISSSHINVILKGAKQGKLSLSDIIFAFRQGISLSSDPTVKDKLRRDLECLLEGYFIWKCSNTGTGNALDEAETQSLHLLVSSYLTSIFPRTGSDTDPPTLTSAEAEESVIEPYGPVPSYVQALIDDGQIPNAVAKKHFYALASLLSSDVGRNSKGTKSLLVQTLKSISSSPFIFPLRLLAEDSCEESIALLLERKPELLLLYGKVTFGTDGIEGWKILVQKLKERVQSVSLGETNGIVNDEKMLEFTPDIISMVLENVYLHLANNLQPSSLEKVLEKEITSKSHYISLSKRLELGNSFVEKVATMSDEFLQVGKHPSPIYNRPS